MSMSAFVHHHASALRISDDGYVATATYDPEDPALRPTADGLLEELEDAGVHITQLVRDNVERFAAGVDQHDGPIVLAEGVRPIYGKPEQILWAERLRDVAEAWRGAMDEEAYPIEALARVEAGQIIGYVEEAVHPRDGRDLTGAVAFAPGTADALTHDETIERSSERPAKLTARVAGRVVQCGQHLSIEPVFTIPSDVNELTGEVTAESCLWIAGRVADGASVRASGQVCIEGSIEGSRVDAGGAVYVRQDVEGRRRSVIRANEVVSAKCASEAMMIVRGDLHIGTSLKSCHACVGGRLFARAARLAGGALFVAEGASIGTLGDPSGTPTHLALGINAPVIYKLAITNDRIASMQGVVERLQRIIRPLGADSSKLSDEHRRRLRSTLSKMAQAEREIEAQKRRSSELLGRVWTGGARCVSAGKRIHPGVTVSIGDRLTTVKRPIAGPVRIELRRIAGSLEIVSVSNAGAVDRVLPSERVGVAEVIRPVDLAAYPKF